VCLVGIDAVRVMIVEMVALGERASMPIAGTPGALRASWAEPHRGVTRNSGRAATNPVTRGMLAA
jgi:hypothetical protein